MNYASQLRGWAIDRTLELWKTTGFKGDMKELFSHADSIMEYAYIAREDLESTAKDLFDLIRNAPDGQSSVDALIGTLDHIKEDRVRQGLDKPPAEVLTLKEKH